MPCVWVGFSCAWFFVELAVGMEALATREVELQTCAADLRCDLLFRFKCLHAVGCGAVRAECCVCQFPHWAVLRAGCWFYVFVEACFGSVGVLCELPLEPSYLEGAGWAGQPIMEPCTNEFWCFSF